LDRREQVADKAFDREPLGLRPCQGHRDRKGVDVRCRNLGAASGKLEGDVPAASTDLKGPRALAHPQVCKNQVCILGRRVDRISMVRHRNPPNLQEDATA
jgi:hypothetical protein